MPDRDRLPYAVWAEPSPPDRERLRLVHRWLAERVPGPAFAPHVTLCSAGAAPAGPPVAARLRDFAAGRPSFPAALGEVSGTDDFFKALFVRVAVPTTLLDEALRAFPGSHGPRVGPHLSLAYADGSSTWDRAALAAGLRERLPASVTFASLALVRPATGSWRDVACWEREAGAPLARRPA